jgi:hypothetical protein
MPHESPRLEILDDLLKTAERNFEAAVKHATTIDDKAQKAGAVAGIILAAGFLKPEFFATLKDQYGPAAPVPLYMAVFLLLISLLLCLRAMWLRKVPAGGMSLAAHERSARVLLAFWDLEKIDEALLISLVVAYRENQLDVWKAAIQSRHEANVVKTRLIHWAQRALAVAVGIAAVSLLMIAAIGGRPGTIK